MKKQILTLLIALLCVIAMPKIASATTIGSCGANTTWSYNSGTLTISGNGVVDDNPWMASHKKDITNVVIQEGVTQIKGWEAFAGCKNLTSVSLPDSLTYLDFYAFKNCTALTSVTIPKNLVECGGYIFKNAGVETVTFADGATVVPGGLFNECEALKTIQFPNTIKTIEASAFEKCTGLTQVTLPQSLTNIGFYAFASCTGIKSITIPKSVTESGGYSFKNAGIETVIFEDGTTVVAGDLFNECEALKTIQFSNTIKTIEASAFEKCTGLTQVTCPYYLEEIGFYSFAGCKNLKEITIYQKCTKYNDYSFKNVTGLIIRGKKNSAAHKYAKSHDYTFKTCKVPALKKITYKKGNLKYTVVTDSVDGNGTVCVAGMVKQKSSVTIPKTVKLESYNYKVVQIAPKAFYKKSKLKKITIQSTTIKSIGKNAFKGINKNAIFKVPKSKYKLYKNKLNKSSGFMKKTMKIIK